jgi:exodeoxyribonuclease-3
MSRYSRVLVLGDYNIAPEDQDVHDPKAWEGKIHVSEPERTELRAIGGLGLTDLFRRFPQSERSYSWWDYRMLAFRRNLGLRIDLQLATAELAEICDACHIDKTPRTWDKPSDHAPVLATFRNTA